jgi:hypothetical protein
MAEQLYDKRIIERNVRKGLLQRKDYDKYLKELPDVADNMQVVELDESGGGGDDGADE